MKPGMEILAEISDALTAQAGGASRAVFEAVAIESYRTGLMTPAQIQQMLGLRSRRETESFLQRAGAFHDYTVRDLERDIAAIRDALRKRSPLRMRHLSAASCFIQLPDEGAPTLFCRAWRSFKQANAGPSP